jgi:hypothetical protein
MPAMLMNRPPRNPVVYRGPVAEIDIRQLPQFDFWCRILGVTRHQLASLVSAVGGNPDVVRQHLKRAA